LRSPDRSSPELLSYLKSLPSVRRKKVAEMRRLLAEGLWHPENAMVADLLLFEHLADSRLLEP